MGVLKIKFEFLEIWKFWNFWKWNLKINKFGILEMEFQKIKKKIGILGKYFENGISEN